MCHCPPASPATDGGYFYAQLFSDEDRWPSEVTRPLEWLVRSVVTAGRCSGISIAIAEAGAVVFRRAFGLADRENAVRVDRDTSFRVASITKQFTAAAIMALCDEGKVCLDDSLSLFHPKFPRANEVSLRQLLNHTAGIHNFSDTIYKRELEITEIDRPSVLAKMSPIYDFEPGTDFGYSNSGYFLLGSVVELLSGMTLEEFFKTRLFDPAGLVATSLEGKYELVANRARGYSLDLKHPDRFNLISPINPNALWAAGGLYSDAHDLIAWALALCGGRIVSKASFEEMTTPARLSDGRLAVSKVVGRDSHVNAYLDQGRCSQDEYGLGVKLRCIGGQREIYHGGGIPGFNSRLSMFPDRRVCMVLLCNTDGGLGDLSDRIADFLFRGINPQSVSLS